MSTCLRLPMASTPLPSSSSPSHSPSFRRPSFKINSILHGKNKTSSGKSSSTHLNPNDSFLSKLAWLATNDPERLNQPTNSDLPPLLDILDPTTNMARGAPVQAVRRQARRMYRGKRLRSGPPDLPSILLDRRIVYIGMPFVPAVTELIIAQLLWLHYDNPTEPVYLFLNSTGTIRDDGEPIALESEGFAIYDTLMQMRAEIHTVALGIAASHACLLLAAGTKGKRYMFPHAKAMIKQPSISASGLVPTSDAILRAKEAVHNRDVLVRLLALHTENSEDEVAEKLKGTYYMDSVEAKSFGVIDKILWRGQEEYMKVVLPPEEWVNTTGRIRGLDS